jgi:DNA-binding transcriptional ArsR family regulator
MVKESYRVTDSATLRALAHPLRQRIILELSVRRSARAADLADILGEPANAISYHLRALAKAGLIVEAPELARDSRDRVWTAAHPEGVYVPPGAADPAGDLLDREYVNWISKLIAETIPEDPRATRGRYMGAALLTKDESHTMFLEVAEILERWRAHGMDAAAANPDDPNRVFHYVTAFVGNRDVEPGVKPVSEAAAEVPTSTVS